MRFHKGASSIIPHNGVILLVEDNKDLSKIATFLLTDYLYNVYPVFSLADARRFLDVKEPDIILLDGELPDGSGFDFCKEIRDKTQAYIIFVTAKSRQLYEMQGILAGGNGYITKPYHIKELLTLIENAMRLRRKEGAIQKSP